MPTILSTTVRKIDSLSNKENLDLIKRFHEFMISNWYSDDNVIGLLNSLNDTVLFRDKYDVKQGLEQENSELRQQYQISDNTRKNLKVQHPDQTQKRKDYPETPATAMKNYICEFCGKEFQSKDQLMMHQDLEFKEKGQL